MNRRTKLKFLSLIIVLIPVAVMAATGAIPDQSHAWTSILPPLVAIGMALIFKEVIFSLLAGIFVGGLILNSGSIFLSITEVPTQIWSALADRSHAGILIFSLMLGGMVGILSRSGGSSALVGLMGGRVKGKRGGLLTTWLMGVIIFFDDYANTLLVGNTMRPFTDSLNISRAKLAYIVDSTAAPVSCTCPISTWVAMELGLITAALAGLGIKANAMMVFIDTIPFRFYSLFAVAFLFTIILSKRDFGKMLKAEIRAKKYGEVYAKGSKPLITEDKDLLETEFNSKL